MLDDRQYMRRGPGGSQGDNYRTGRTALFALIAINALTFILFGMGRNNSLVLNAGAFSEGEVIPLLTAIFMHAGFFHIFFNMFSLYIFGSLSAPLLGGKKFVFLFLFSGIIGNLCWLASVWGNPNYSVLGASGAVMGVLIATAMMVPEVEMLLLFVPFPVKLRTMALVFVGLDILNEIAGSGSVAYMSHIGGAIAGYLFMILFQRNMVRWNPLAKLFGRGGIPGEAKMPRGWTLHTNPDPRKDPNITINAGEPVSQKELDYLLDKISKEGINSLSEAEMARLRKAREQMRGH